MTSKQQFKFLRAFSSIHIFLPPSLSLSHVDLWLRFFLCNFHKFTTLLFLLLFFSTTFFFWQCLFVFLSFIFLFISILLSLTLSCSPFSSFILTIRPVYVLHEFIQNVNSLSLFSSFFQHSGFTFLLACFFVLFQKQS